MPQTRQRPDDQQVQVPLQRAAAIAAQGNINIFSEPGGQGNVPFAPEFGETPGTVRMIKVFRQHKAHGFSQTDGHIGITGEIKINLEGKGDQAQPGTEGAGLGKISIHLAPETAESVCQQHLFRQTDAEPAKAAAHLIPGRPGMGNELFLQIRIADYGTGNQLGEQGKINAEGDRGPLGARIAAVDVNDIGKRLEGKKRNAGGKNRVADIKTPAGHIPEGITDKADIFEPEERKQVKNNNQNQNQFAL